MKHCIYIAGKITGREEWEDDFRAAEAYVRFFNPDARIYTPRLISKKVERKIRKPGWGDYMREDLKYLARCREIYLIENWTESRGAKFERDVAAALGMEIRIITFRSLEYMKDAMGLQRRLIGAAVLRPEFR